MTWPTIQQAQAFREVAGTGSYSEAARNLGYEDSNSGRVAVRKLADRFAEAVNVGRLLRPGRQGRIELTGEGTAVMPMVRTFIASAEALAAIEPIVRVSAYPAVMEHLIESDPELLTVESGVEVRAVSDRARSDRGEQLIEDLVGGRLDIVLAPAGLGREGVIERALYPWTLRVLLPGRSTRRDAAPVITPSELQHFAIAAAPHGHGSRTMLEEAFQRDGLRLVVAFESPSQELLRTVARCSDRHATVVPDDAFGGGPDNGLGPELRTARGVRYAGQFSLYVADRPPEDRRFDAAHRKAEALRATSARIVAAVGRDPG